MKFRIREADIDDSVALARVQIDSYRDTYTGLFPVSYFEGFSYEEQAHDWRELMSGESPDLLYLAEIDGEIVAYVLARPLQGDANEGEIVALHVRKAQQGQGIGRALMAIVAQSLKEKGSRSLMLWVLAENKAARAFYEHLGGQPAGEQTITPAEGVSAQEVAYR